MKNFKKLEKMIEFKKVELSATFMDASGNRVRRIQQVRTDPVTLKKCRITPSRALENERGTEILYNPPEKDMDGEKCPFCPKNLLSMTPCLKVSLTARSSYAPWVRSDFTGFDIASGEMATFTLTESVAGMAKEFWNENRTDG